jgi:hypothetical protein
MTPVRIETETHIFFISPSWLDEPGFQAEYYPRNPKTGKPWQASRRIDAGADVMVRHFSRPTSYSTIEKATDAVMRQVDKLTKRRGR